MPAHRSEPRASADWRSGVSVLHFCWKPASTFCCWALSELHSTPASLLCAHTGAATSSAQASRNDLRLLFIGIHLLRRCGFRLVLRRFLRLVLHRGSLHRAMLQ